MNANDSQAISIALQGDKSGYETLIKRYKKMVYGIAWSHLGDKDLSEDAAQETFVKAYCYLRTLRDPSKFQGWLARIARNVSNSMGCKVRREDAFQKQWAILESQDAKPRREEPESLTQQLWESFAELPAIHREALTLFYIEGKSIIEAAAALGITEQALKTRLCRARAVLRQQLEQKLEDTLADLQPSKSFTRSVLVLLPMSPKGGVIGAGGALAVFGKLFAGLSFLMWILVAQALAMFGLYAMYSKLEEASFENTPENRPIKALIRRGYMTMAAMIIPTVVLVYLLNSIFSYHDRSAQYAVFKILCILDAYMLWLTLKLLRVNTSIVVIGMILKLALFFIAAAAIGFFHAPLWLNAIAFLPAIIITCFINRKIPTIGLSTGGARGILFTGSALGIFGDFEDDQSLGRRLTRTELLSFAKFLGGLWLVGGYRWRADGITLLDGVGSRITITWDGACTATMSAKHLKVTRQLFVGRSVEAAELQDNACRVVRFALNCFLRGDLEAARRVLSPYETPSAQSLTTARQSRVKSRIIVFLMLGCLVMLLVALSVKDKDFGAYYILIVAAVSFLVAIIAMAITLRRTRRQNRSL